MSFLQIPEKAIYGGKIPDFSKVSPIRVIKLRGLIYKDGSEILIAHFEDALNGDIEIIHEIDKSDRFFNMPLKKNELKLTDIFCDITDGSILYHLYLSYILDFDIHKDLQSDSLAALSSMMKSGVPKNYPFRETDQPKEMVISVINKNLIIKDIR